MKSNRSHDKKGDKKPRSAAHTKQLDSGVNISTNDSNNVVAGAQVETVAAHSAELFDMAIGPIQPQFSSYNQGCSSREMTGCANPDTNQKSSTMASPSNMDKFLINLENLPAQLRQNLSLIQNIDSTAQKLMQDINKQTDNYIMTKKYLSDKNKETINSIQRQFIKAKEYGDDKVQLALQTYALVDEQIKKLDSNLAWLNAKIEDKASNASASIEEGSQQKILKRTDKNETKKKQYKKGGKKTRATAHKSLDSSVDIPLNFPTEEVTGVQLSTGVAHLAEVIDMPVDPNEPKFCLCNQVSFGEMIGCDNPDCTIEWFHFICVNLKTKPKGKWFCPKCKQTEEKQ